MEEQIVYVNLKQGDIARRVITPQMRKRFIGAIGINVMILMEEQAHRYDALSEKNVLIFGIGPITGTGLMAGNRCVITARSPITDIYGDSNIGGDFPVKMRSLGIHHLVFRGKAETPQYLLCSADGQIRLCAAEDLWGKSTDEVTDILIKRHGNDCDVACIGKAGEELVRYSSIIMSKNHAAGRMGTGCVMGSKNLKAIVVQGRKSTVEYRDPQALQKIKEKWIDGAKKSAISHMGARYGTLFLLEANNRSGGLPVRNFQAGKDPKAEALYPVVFNRDYKIEKEACYACPIGCSKKYQVKDGKYKGLTGSRIEFGAASIGPMTGVFDWPGVLHMKLLCDRYGIDTIEAGAVIALAMEGCERGILKKEQLFGRNVKFGSVEDAEYLMERIVRREGIGDLLAEGVYRAGKALGLEDYVFCINKSYTGLQSNARLVRSLGYITSTRGGDHLKSFAFSMQNGGYYIARHLFHIKNARKELANPVNIGRILWWHENYKIVVDCIGVCLFAIQGLPSLGIGMFDDFADIMNAIYGLDMSPEDVFHAAERIYQLENVFNVACGLKLEHYIWPRRKQEEPVRQEFLERTVLTEKDRDQPGMLPEYFRYRGLTEKGRPVKKRLEELDILDLCEGYPCEEAEAESMAELLRNVALVIHYTWKDRLHVNLSCFLMDRMLELKDRTQLRKLEKRQYSS